MVSVAWLFVFSKFIELTDTVSESLRRPCHCLLGRELGAQYTWCRCFLQLFWSDLVVLLSGITAEEAALGYCRDYFWQVIALEAVG